MAQFPCRNQKLACLGSADLVLQPEARLAARPSSSPARGNCLSTITKPQGACVLARAGGALYTMRHRSKFTKPDLILFELRRLGSVSLSMIECWATHVLCHLFDAIFCLRCRCVSSTYDCWHQTTFRTLLDCFSVYHRPKGAYIATFHFATILSGVGILHSRLS